MNPKKVLVAVDGSPHSDKVVAAASECARMFGSHLLLVHCHHRFPTILGEPYRQKEISGIILEAEAVIAPYLRQLQEQIIEVESRLLEEPAGSAIVDVAKIEKCDLIIMGSRGLSNLAGLIVGSVTNRVLQTAPCSVLVVR
jgi:nucleotide-binding universal stress UspA family protein